MERPRAAAGGALSFAADGPVFRHTLVLIARSVMSTGVAPALRGFEAGINRRVRSGDAT
jgi:hypothetical protein